MIDNYAHPRPILFHRRTMRRSIQVPGRSIVSVWVEKGKGIHFGDSVGLMGDSSTHDELILFRLGVTCLLSVIGVLCFAVKHFNRLPASVILDYLHRKIECLDTPSQSRHSFGLGKEPFVLLCTWGAAMIQGTGSGLVRGGNIEE
jgi:hypothetical protein